MQCCAPNVTIVLSLHVSEGTNINLDKLFTLVETIFSRQPLYIDYLATTGPNDQNNAHARSPKRETETFSSLIRSTLCSSVTIDTILHVSNVGIWTELTW